MNKRIKKKDKTKKKGGHVPASFLASSAWFSFHGFDLNSPFFAFIDFHAVRIGLAVTSLALLRGIVGVGLPAFACDLCAGTAVGSIRAWRHCTDERVGGKTRGRWAEGSQPSQFGKWCGTVYRVPNLEIYISRVGLVVYIVNNLLPLGWWFNSPLCTFNKNFQICIF